MAKRWTANRFSGFHPTRETSQLGPAKECLDWLYLINTLLQR